MGDERLHIRLSADLAAELREHVITTDRPLSRVVRRAIAEYLDRYREAEPE